MHKPSLCRLDFDTLAPISSIATLPQSLLPSRPHSWLPPTNPLSPRYPIAGRLETQWPSNMHFQRNFMHHSLYNVKTSVNWLIMTKIPHQKQKCRSFPGYQNSMSFPDFPGKWEPCICFSNLKGSLLGQQKTDANKTGQKNKSISTICTFYWFNLSYTWRQHRAAVNSYNAMQLLAHTNWSWTLTKIWLKSPYYIVSLCSTLTCKMDPHKFLLQISATQTHTHTCLTALCPGLPGWAGTRKVKTSLDFTEARDSEWQWYQQGHMQVCISLQTDNHASTQPLSFLQAGCPSCRPTNSVKALKAKRSDQCHCSEKW